MNSTFMNNDKKITQSDCFKDTAIAPPIESITKRQSTSPLGKHTKDIENDHHLSLLSEIQKLSNLFLPPTLKNTKKIQRK